MSYSETVTRQDLENILNAIFPSQYPASGISAQDENDNTTNVQALLTELLERVSVIGERYVSSSSNTISSTAVDTKTNGASITVPKGTYVILGEWIFNTRTTTGTTVSEVDIYNATTSTLMTAFREVSGANNYNRLQSVCLAEFPTQTTVYVRGGTTRPYTSATSNYIFALRLR